MSKSNKILKGVEELIPGKILRSRADIKNKWRGTVVFVAKDGERNDSGREEKDRGWSGSGSGGWQGKVGGGVVASFFNASGFALLKCLEKTEEWRTVEVIDLVSTVNLSKL